LPGTIPEAEPVTFRFANGALRLAPKFSHQSVRGSGAKSAFVALTLRDFKEGRAVGESVGANSAQIAGPNSASGPSNNGVCSFPAFSDFARLRFQMLTKGADRHPHIDRKGGHLGPSQPESRPFFDGAEPAVVRASRRAGLFQPGIGRADKELLPLGQRVRKCPA